ncbi:MFS transporter [Paenibacillus glucanolyticus]|uniref:MFS transporter n=1 Tax=Paenibacillus glucanolyticus TaxID=59843 RepID=A0A163H6M1_9BACL|nr:MULTISPECIES: MFS transporter [Paenibacillus]ANA79401.1 MFS transporter [Paenibacillus glucanolyticus]AVV56653.1 MFS transporter [Paenibacillus glucanolyticus]AWP25818.1 MFS transporter [Paenibacillus sp. Cedars]ETT29805.1 major facilitator superfamily protein [Paenibacillus sp. FSL R5-808]KZS45343.1 MFS transporter [Paenibacillus glucanolyticus]
MKTALWLYMFLFLAFFDLHAQYPVLTPFAISLGAAPTFIGWMMGIYALTHLPGNLIAGNLIDRHGSRRYIIFSLTAAGVILLLQAHVQLPWQLLALRSISGFVLAFLSPACLALLASLSRDPVTQGKYMSGHGVVHTLASVLSPAAGAFIVANAGFSGTFQSLGWLLIFTGFMAFFSLPKRLSATAANKENALASKEEKPARLPFSLRLYLIPFAIACSQGILFFEIPLRESGKASIMSTGILFSVISLGALVTLSMLFLNRYAPHIRVALGVLGLAICFYALAAADHVPIMVILFSLGLAKGLLFPALSSLFIELSGGGRLGKVFSLQSIAMSLGSFVGPIAAGQFRTIVSPYFIAFLMLMTVLLLLPKRNREAPSTVISPL